MLHCSSDKSYISRSSRNCQQKNLQSYHAIGACEVETKFQLIAPRDTHPKESGNIPHLGYFAGIGIRTCDAAVHQGSAR